jgi:asparagine synthase (glutamine-hydrolysing)
MWCGAFGDSRVPKIREELGSLLTLVRRAEEPAVFESSSALLVSGGYFPSKLRTGRHWKCVSGDGRSGLVWSGELYRSAEITEASVPTAADLWDRYHREGIDGFKKLNGAFTVAVWDESRKTGVLAGDQLGILPIYYAAPGGAVVFGSIPELVLQMAGEPPALDVPAVLKFLTFCYNPGFETLYKGVRRLRPGHCLEFHDGRTVIRPFWRLRFDPEKPSSESELAENIRLRMAGAVRAREEGGIRTGVFLSGGLDSSSMVALLSGGKGESVQTFSFRCLGQSFDESHYAQKVADAFGTRHTLVEYRPEDVPLIADVVVHQDEPFCDAGINVATYLLGRAASGKIDDLFTGDGGDELFAGHPVYAADRAAACLRHVPRALLSPLFFLGRRLRDSEHKKDWRVKVKRFSASWAFPEALGTHRWRAYYLPSELKSLLAPDLRDAGFEERPFEDILQFNREGANADPLARSLYSDYFTAVHFYMSRMGLVRTFGIRPKFPLLDPSLVEFCATVPSRYKFKGISGMKHIEKLAVGPLLPREIVHRKDKLGHSIPLKNWMRDDRGVREFMRDLLSEETVRRRGLFQPGRIQAMIREHLEHRENHAHRLWALMVLELWMAKHVDRPKPVRKPGVKS